MGVCAAYRVVTTVTSHSAASSTSCICTRTYVVCCRIPRTCTHTETCVHIEYKHSQVATCFRSITLSTANRSSLFLELQHSYTTLHQPTRPCVQPYNTFLATLPEDRNRFCGKHCTRGHKGWYTDSKQVQVHAESNSKR